MVVDVVRSLPSLKSSGLSKLRYEHLQQCVGQHESTSEKEFVRLLTRFISHIIHVYALPGNGSMLSVSPLRPILGP